MHVEVPENVLVGSGQTREAFVEEAKFLLALKLFEIGRLPPAAPRLYAA
jgi:hypothetical protein